jgi:hypothetical protein
LRYQEWWFTEFPRRFSEYFDEVLVLGRNAALSLEKTEIGQFAPIAGSIFFETALINEYMNVKLRSDDVLLVNDLSFPGLFTNILFHKRPKKCFAICHASSKNRYDYFAKDRKIKYPTERATAKLFDKVFVASMYHRRKLNWPNVISIPFPLPPFHREQRKKEDMIIIVARPGIQKRTTKIEKELKQSGWEITTCDATSWEEYYQFIARATVMLITAKEETYGYQVIDALKNGCIPLAPNKFSYPELLPKDYLYNTIDELDNMIDHALNEDLKIPDLLVSREAQLFYDNLAFFMSPSQDY